MARFVGVCVGLFVIAAGFISLTERSEIAVLAQAFGSESVLHQIAWAVIVLVPVGMLPFAVWLWGRVGRNRQAAEKLEQRLDGVWQGARDLRQSQGDTESDLQHLALTDPEDAIAALKRRLAESERFADVQRRRNEDDTLETRIDDLRAQQRGLKERLAPVLELRRSLEQVFTELDSQQNDIDRALAEIASGEDALAIDIRLKSLSDFVRRSHARCDQIESASKTVASLNDACADLTARLTPLAAAEGGIKSRLAELTATSETLSVQVGSLEFTPEGPLGDRVQQLTAGKATLDAGVSRLSAQFFQLGGLRKDIAGLFAALDRGLSALAVANNGEGSANAEARTEELKRFVEQTQDKFDDLETHVIGLGQLKVRLDELQARLVPLASEESGVVKLVEALQDIRERLIAKIRRIEGGQEGDLAARVRLFADSKRELEVRVSSLADQFTKLATLRSDIAGLFDKLSSAVNASSN